VTRQVNFQIAQNVATHFLSNLTPNFVHGKTKQKMWDSSVTFQKLPKVNNYSIGEKSPNLVTLPTTSLAL
jgi:hypothetical protein